MNVLHVISSLKLEQGGPAQGVRNITSYYAELGVTATVLSMDEPEDDLGSVDHLKVVTIGKGKGTFSYHPKLVKQIKHIANQFDAVIVHGLWQYHGHAVRAALKNTKVPYYLFPHGMLDPYFKQEYPIKHLKKYLYWFVTQYVVLRDAKAVLFTCEEEKRLAAFSFKPYHVTAEVVNYGTTIPPIGKQTGADQFYAEYPELKNKRIFLFLSRIHEKKGCDLLIQAFAKALESNKDIHLVMAGPDQTGWKAQLIALAQSFNAEAHITWTGMLKGELKWAAMKAAEVFILPSHQENFGISVAESLALGTPVLISDKVNIWREIVEMKAGLVGEDTLPGTEKLISQWLALQPEEKHHYEQNAQNCFEKKFNIMQTSKNIITRIRGDKSNI